MNRAEIVREELAAKHLAEKYTGIEVKMNSSECRDYKSTHESCSGCLCEHACSKVVWLLLATFDIDPRSKVEEVLKSQDIKAVDFNFADEY